MVAWWRRKVVPRARRAWAAVSRRLRDRKPGSGGILKLHDDVQSCGYKDVQVMFDMITSELEAASQAAQKPLPSPRKGAVLRPPSAWPSQPLLVDDRRGAGACSRTWSTPEVKYSV